MRRLLLISALAVAAAVAVAFTAAGSSTTRTVTTNGHGVVTVVSDQATIDAGVRTSGSTAAAALAANGNAMTRVIAALKQVGVKTIQTQEVSLYPQTGPRGKVTGFVAQNTVTVTAPIAGAGRLIDASTARPCATRLSTLARMRWRSPARSGACSRSPSRASSSRSPSARPRRRPRPRRSRPGRSRSPPTCR